MGSWFGRAKHPTASLSSRSPSLPHRCACSVGEKCPIKALPVFWRRNALFWRGALTRQATYPRFQSSMALEAGLCSAHPSAPSSHLPALASLSLAPRPPVHPRPRPRPRRGVALQSQGQIKDLAALLQAVCMRPTHPCLPIRRGLFQDPQDAGR